MGDMVTIRALAPGGRGVGHLEGEKGTYFVAGALPGERVEVDVTRVRRRMSEAVATAVHDPSPDRVDPACPAAGRCGGCDWQHVDLERQPSLKAAIASEQLTRALKRDIEVVAPPVTEPGAGYRRRARMHYELDGNQVRLGFRGARSRVVEAIDTCPVLVPPLDRALQRLRPLLAELDAPGEVVGLCGDDGRVVVGLPGVRPTPERLGIARELLDEGLAGIWFRGGRAREGVGERRVPVSDGSEVDIALGPFGFVQPSARTNSELVRTVVEMAAPADARVLELYAGSGNFTRELAQQATRVWTCESDRGCVSALRELAERNRWSVNAKHGDATRVLQRLAASQQRYDVVVLDPPRAGLGVRGAADLAKVAEERIVYVACDVSALARDVAALESTGWQLRKIQAFDPLPMTSHMELVALLERV